ncbi:TetR/AcrR family transcriptional regulator [Kitasatospora sp. NPDC092039]|uniref:TetR/AcrR family transcriptional regulator n=1 Tax=Kitasatospora sp. NPDC092039 TaxID=3364086 RepID=UPI0037F7B3F5
MNTRWHQWSCSPPPPRVRAPARTRAARGVDALSLAEIARRVRVTPAALYRHFENLADIVRHPARDIVADLALELQAAVDAEPATDLASRLIAPSRLPGHGSVPPAIPCVPRARPLRHVGPQAR